MAAEAGEAVNLDTLSVQQLTQVKNQLDQELEHLTSSFTQLQAAQAKFRDCLRCVQGGKSSALQENKPILVPLTNSLYVGGTLASASHVLVDVGTGFYVEKVPNPPLLLLPPPRSPISIEHEIGCRILREQDD
ncbi:hypothetical protein CHU98_g5370 [Xylaria longipes]|nr:hypothetical protein CHU98_g5370 [Xylaria longipes]